MRNCVTRKEISEQLGNQILDFSFFYGNHFVFSGIDALDNEISMFVHIDVLSYASKRSYAKVSDYVNIDKNFVKFVIINKDFQTVYED